MRPTDPTPAPNPSPQSRGVGGYHNHPNSQLSPTEAAAALSDLSLPWQPHIDQRQASTSTHHLAPRSTSPITPDPRPAASTSASSSIPGPSSTSSANLHARPGHISGTKRPNSSSHISDGDTAKTTPTTSGPKRQKRSTAVSTACAGCRRRKSRCDGATPSCSTCLAHKEECTYSAGDGRKPPSKEYVQSLQERIRALERALEEQTQQSCSGATPSDLSTNAPDSLCSGEGRAARPQNHGGRFKVVRGNQVVAYGPTSSYLHFEGDSTDSGQPTELTKSLDDVFPEDDEELWDKHNSASISESSHWSRWLPQGVPKDLHDGLLNHFFAYVNPFTLFVDEPRFYRDLALCAQPNSTFASTAWYSPILHNVLLALGSKYSQDRRANSASWQLDSLGQPVDPISHTNQGLRFAETAATYLEKEWKAPFLSTVIGCMLLGTFHQVSAQPTLGWTYEGIGVRIANVIGLHMDSRELVSRGIISPELQRARSYCWATVAFQDKLWSYTHGRLPAIRMCDTENTQPPPISASMDAMPWLSYPRGLKLPGLRSTILHHTAKLTGLAERIHALNYSLQSLTPTRHQLLRSEIRAELMEWHSDLPQSCSIGANASRSLTPAAINLNIAGWYMVVLLYRSHFRQEEESGSGGLGETAEETPASICLSASAKIMMLLRLYRKQHGLRTAHPSLSNMTFCVGTIFILAAANSRLSEGSRTTQSQLEELDVAIDMLNEIGGSSTFARLSAEALGKMKKEWLRPKEPSGPSTAESALQAVMTNPSKLSELTDPVSEFSKLLTSLGWTPPAATASAALRPTSTAPNAQDVHFSGNSEPVMSAQPHSFGHEGVNGYAHQSVNPTDLGLDLHPSFFSFGFSGMDDQLVSLFPQHLGGEGVGAGWPCLPSSHDQSL